MKAEYLARVMSSGLASWMPSPRWRRPQQSLYIFPVPHGQVWRGLNKGEEEEEEGDDEEEEEEVKDEPKPLLAKLVTSYK